MWITRFGTLITKLRINVNRAEQKYNLIFQKASVHKENTAGILKAFKMMSTGISWSQGFSSIALESHKVIADVLPSSYDPRVPLLCLGLRLGSAQDSSFLLLQTRQAVVVMQQKGLSAPQHEEETT